MILTCPKCNARFLVDAAALQPNGRDVRCGRCRYQWFATPPQDKPAPDMKAARIEPVPEPPKLEPQPLPSGSNLPVLAQPRRRALGLILGWALLGLVVVALGLAFVERERIMDAYPGTRDLFAAFGFAVPPPGAGLQITDLTSARTVQNGVPVLQGEGRIINKTSVERRVPALRGALRDASGQELQSWTFGATAPSLAPGDSTSFRFEIRQPAAGAAELSITFQGD